MKIIHCADIHIGSVMKNLPADKSKIRKREILDSFFRMLAFADKNQVSVIIIAGDLFDVTRIAHSTRKEILDMIEHYPQIAFLYLRGNHDDRTIFDDHEIPAPNNLFALGASEDWQYFNIENVCIAGADLSKQGGQSFYEKLKFDKAKFNIAVLHGDLRTIQLDKLKGKQIDYLALGDIHIPDMQSKKLDMRGVYGYCGCLEGRGYDEAGERGFFLLTIENGNMQREFHSVAKRKYEVIDLDITGLDSHSKIDVAIKEKTELLQKENIIKVVLVGKRKADTQIERENLETKLRERFFYAKIKDESKLDMTSVDFENEISLRSKFVALVKQSELDETEKDKIIEYGIKALRGEAIDL